MGNFTIPSHVGGDYWHLGQGHTLIHNTLLGKGKVRLSRAPLEFQVKRLSFDSTGLNKIVSNDQIFKIVTIFALNCLESQKPFDPKPWINDVMRQNSKDEMLGYTIRLGLKNLVYKKFLQI